MGTIEAVIWDMDGVLVDTGQFQIQTLQEAFATVGIALSEAQVKSVFGMNSDTICRIFLGNLYSANLAKTLTDLKEVRFRKVIQGKLEILPGVRPLLKAFYNRGIPMAIGSSAPVANIDAIVQALEIAPYFKAQVSGATMPGKPDPSVFLTAAKQLGIDPARCLVIEDAIAGIAAAKSAGMKVIAVATTFPIAQLQDAQPNLVVETLEAVDAEWVLAI